MQRLSNNEKIVLLIAVVATAGGIVGLAAGQDVIVQIAFLMLLLLIVLAVMLLTLRLERLSKQQHKARQEIYQVLYWLNGSDKRTEHQARKTRDTVREKTEQIRKMLQQIRPLPDTGNKGKNNVKSASDRRAFENLHEVERLHVNKIIAILDAQWEVLQSITDDRSLSDERSNEAV